MTGVRLKFLFVLAVVACLLSGAACAHPTQAILRISLQGLPCETETGPSGKSITDVVLYVGQDLAELDAREGEHIVAGSIQCSDIVGNAFVVLYPSKSMRAFVRVVAGTKQEMDGSFERRPAENCTTGVDGVCLRATRSFEYIKHETVEIPVVLDAACVGKVCPNGYTCDEGQCTTAACENRSDCGGDAGAPHDAGQTDAGNSFAFTCSGGVAKWSTTPCPGNASCYRPASNSLVCGPNPTTCFDGEFLPCCELPREGGLGRQCCLSSKNAHPIQLKSATIGTPATVAACSAQELCFVDQPNTCVLNRVCVPRGNSGWGTCQPR